MFTSDWATTACKVPTYLVSTYILYFHTFCDIQSLIRTLNKRGECSQLHMKRHATMNGNNDVIENDLPSIYHFGMIIERSWQSESCQKSFSKGRSIKVMFFLLVKQT